MTKDMSIMKNSHLQNWILSLSEHLSQTILWISVAFRLVWNLLETEYIRFRQHKVATIQLLGGGGGEGGWSFELDKLFISPPVCYILFIPHTAWSKIFFLLSQHDIFCLQILIPKKA